MTDTLRIAVPTHGAGGLDAERSAHFGHADSFTIVDLKNGEIVDDRAIVNPPHAHGGCGATVAMLAQAGVSTAIVVGMGGGPRAAMNTHGMTPLFDDQSPTPRVAIEAFSKGRRVGFGDSHTCRGHH